MAAALNSVNGRRAALSLPMVALVLSLTVIAFSESIQAASSSRHRSRSLPQRPAATAEGRRTLQQS